jgi:predicted lipid-binding transport protein (Tim44 family)
MHEAGFKTAFSKRTGVNIFVLILLAFMAAFILYQLYNVLGKQVGFRVEDKVAAPKTDEIELMTRSDKAAEGPRMPNLEILKARDVNFNEINFLEKAREAYEQVVLAFHKGDIDTVKDKLSETVFGVFSKAIKARTETSADTVSFVDTPKADIDVIDFKDDLAQIRVRFLSELAYESPLPPTTAAESPVEAAPAGDTAVPTVEPVTATSSTKKADVAKPVRTHKRTAEYWTFQKGLRTPGNAWLLTKVEAARA